MSAASDPGAVPREGNGDIVAVFDLDGTLTRYATYLRYLLQWLWRHPGRIAHCWRLPIDLLLFRAHLRDNAWLKARFLGAVLGRAAPSVLNERSSQFVDHLVATGLRSGAVAALRAHQDRGDRTVLLSASLDIFVPLIAKRLGFSDCICTGTERDKDGYLTGALSGANCRGVEKVKRLEALLEQHPGKMLVVAYADQDSDHALLTRADRSIIVNPGRKSRRAARERGWTIVSW